MRMKNLRIAAIAYIIVGATALAADIFLKDRISGVGFLGITFIALGSIVEMIRSEMMNIHNKLDQK